MRKWLSNSVAVGLVAFLAVPAVLGAEPSAPKASTPPAMIRMLSPVRLPSEPGDKLTAAVSATRELLETFQVGGFEYAVWAVDKLPARDEDMKPWVATCREAFPAGIVVALDSKLEKSGPSLPADQLKVFLSALLAPTLPALPKPPAAPGKVTVLVNFTALNNCECFDNTAAATAATVQTAKLVREISPKTALWLLLDDCSKAAPKIPEWLAAAGDLVDGFYVNRRHEWNAGKDGGLGAASAPLFATGKPVIRAGFRYSSPRMRPPLEAELTSNYRQRMAVYEGWIADSPYAGYAREIGATIPGEVSANMDLVRAMAVVGGSGQKK